MRDDAAIDSEAAWLTNARTNAFRGVVLPLEHTLAAVTASNLISVEDAAITPINQARDHAAQSEAPEHPC